MRRLCIAGGDTSSYAARALGIEALEMIAPLTPGAPVNSTLTRCPELFSNAAASRDTPRFTGPAPSIFSVFMASLPSPPIP